MKRIILLTAMLVLAAVTVSAQETGKQGPPPALVAVAQSTNGVIAPHSNFVGTVYFPEVSDVAAEIGGRVLNVHFDEGDTVQRGAKLVALDTALTQRKLAAAKAQHEEALAALELARLELARRDELFKSGSIAQQELDNSSYSVKELESRAAALQQTASRLQLEIAKSSIPAPFDGIVLARNIERGEWLAAGSPAARIARNDAMEALVNVPERVLPYIANDIQVEVTIGGKRHNGRIEAILMEGDEATRTFPVKIVLPDAKGLAQGMQATAHLPIDSKGKAIIVPRDAITEFSGNQAVFVAREGKANMIPVKVLAYHGLKAAVAGPGLAAEMNVVVKGNERLYPGAPLRIQGQ